MAFSSGPRSLGTHHGRHADVLRSARIARSSASRATTTTGGTTASIWREDLPLRTRLQLVDFHTFLPGLVLTKVDRTSMAVSLEARVPLLDAADHRVFVRARRRPAVPRRRRKACCATLIAASCPTHSRPPQERFRHPALLLQGRRRRPHHPRARAAQPFPETGRNRPLTESVTRAGVVRRATR